MVKQVRKSLALLTGAAAILITGCSGGSSRGGGGSDSTLGPNIYGQVSQSVTLSAPSGVIMRGKPGALFSRKPEKTNKMAELAVSGCTIAALDLLTNVQISTAQSGTDGTFTLKGLDAGKTYKVIATCGASEKYTNILKADTSAIADKDPEVTSPISTVIAAKIIQAVLTAVESLD